MQYANKMMSEGQKSHNTNGIFRLCHFKYTGIKVAWRGNYDRILNTLGSPCVLAVSGFVDITFRKVTVVQRLSCMSTATSQLLQGSAITCAAYCFNNGNTTNQGFTFNISVIIKIIKSSFVQRNRF